MKFHRFTPQQELELLRAYRRTGDEQVREQLILSLMSIVNFIAGKIAAGSETLMAEDLIGDGVEGVIYAIDNFKIESGNQIGTYTYLSVRHAILKSEFLRDTIRAPYKPRFVKPQVISIETPVNTEENLRIADTLSIPSYQAAADMKIDMDAALDKLTQQEVFVLEHYYGLYSESLSQQKIARILSCSHTWVSKIRRKALKKLKRFLDE